MTREQRLAVFAATSGHSGVDRNLKNLIPAFAARGVAVDILNVRGHGPVLTTLPSGVRVIDLGASHVNTSFAALVHYLRREPPAVLLSDKDKVNRLALWARRYAGVTTRVAVRLGIHVSTNLAERGWFERTVQTFSIRRFYPWADVILVPSQGVADDLAALGRLPRDKVCVVPNPVVTPELEALAAQPVSHPWFEDASVPVILGVGELGARKDFETLIKAVALVRRERRCRLLILGRGRQREALLALGATLGLGDDLALPGFVANPYAYMSRASVFASASRFEGFANVIAEALAVGVPVVATDCPSGPREILEDGRHGRLVPIGDAAAMAQAITATLTAPPLRTGLQAAAQRYHVTRVADDYLRALDLSSPTRRETQC